MSSLWATSAAEFARFPLFPLFQLVHYTIIMVSIRESKGAMEFSALHPLASLVSGIISCTGGTLALHLFLGLPLAEPFSQPEPILLMAIIWWLVFHFPGDYFYQLVTLLPVKVLLIIAKEMRRARMVAVGIAAAKAIYPNQWTVCVIAGTLKSSGSKLSKTGERLIRNAPDASEHELLKPSFVSKASFSCSVLYALNEFGFHFMPSDQLMLACGSLLSVIRLSDLLMGTGDPFRHVERVGSRLLRQSSKKEKSS
eukprot:m.9488 g.9488  ORF g.9488 m.9488 type:complete len:254 (+) comp21385_c0_seq4:145-906(+)